MPQASVRPRLTVIVQLIISMCAGFFKEHSGKEGEGACVLPVLCTKAVMKAEETAEDIQSHLWNSALVIMVRSRAVIQNISFELKYFTDVNQTSQQLLR